MSELRVDASTVLARSTAEGEAEYHGLIARLQQRWPDLQALPRQPTLAAKDTWAGIWFVGRNDYDSETDTYQTYRVLRYGIPFVFLGSYRVYETSAGAIVFVGRLPLPVWAQAVNVLGIPPITAAAVVGFGGLISTSGIRPTAPWSARQRRSCRRVLFDAEFKRKRLKAVRVPKEAGSTAMRVPMRLELAGLFVTVE